MEEKALEHSHVDASELCPRVMLFDVQPVVDGGRFPAKRVVGDQVTVSCDLICDGHDAVAGELYYWPAAPEGSAEGQRTGRVGLEPLGNDRWAATFEVTTPGRWYFGIDAWVDEYGTWSEGLRRKHEAEQDVALELAAGVQLLEAAAQRASGLDRNELLSASGKLWQADPGEGDTAARVRFATSERVRRLMATYPDRRAQSRTDAYVIVVEPLRALSSAWYELFPRSLGKPGSHGTLADVIAVLPYVASMGFDVLYLPPIHPIGHSFRKGPNNALTAGPTDPGSPWAIGAETGGHKEIHPELGSVEDFKSLVRRADEYGISIALDIAFQASPDHPYVKQHPEWFKRRADGSIQYAENPPKKYQDVYPFDLAGANYKPLWEELKSVFEVWIARGVKIFRVDNPHTKPLSFWEYCISELRQKHPELIFLSEAFTRPKLMYALAKVGFSQSYTYFTWRTTSHDLRRYLEELTQSPVREFFRPNFWPNTPDILPEHLQYGERAMFVSRAVLASTLSASWGIYGPAFELMDHLARPGAEEYLDSEKFQLRIWDLERQDSLRPLIERLNTVRRENTALQRNDTLAFHDCDNPSVIAYSKTDAASKNVILVVVNLEPHHHHSTWISLNLDALGAAQQESFQVHDLLSDARYQWHGARAYAELHPELPAHVFRIRRKVRSERNFEYFL